MCTDGRTDRRRDRERETVDKHDENRAVYEIILSASVVESHGASFLHAA